MWMECFPDSKPSHTVTVKPYKTRKETPCFANAIFSPEDDTCKLLLLNLDSKTKAIRKNTKIGFADMKASDEVCSPELYDDKIVYPPYVNIKDYDRSLRCNQFDISLGTELISTKPPNHINININENLSEEQKIELRKIVTEFSDVHSRSNLELGHCKIGQFHIDVKDAKPVKQNPYRCSLREDDLIGQFIEELLQNDIIEPSNSPWASPIVIVKKKDGTSRMCIDYRKVNSFTVKDSYPLPRIDDIFDSLADAKIFSKFDLTSGYYQIDVSKDSRDKTAFTCKKGLFQFKRLPFGLSNAPPAFQRTMDLVLASLKWKCALIYIDDIIVYSKTFEQHLEDLRKVYTCFRNANLKVKPSKCHLAMNEISFLGHKISARGIETDDRLVSSIKNFPTPKNIKSVQSFLGLSNFYRKFIPDYAKIAFHLYELCKNQRFEWLEVHEMAFRKLKEQVAKAPTLTHFNPDKPHELHTDASDIGIGAVLYQLEDDREWHPIAFLSKKLGAGQKHYGSTERECYALVWALENLRCYLDGIKFTVVTDNKALIWLTTTLKGNLGRGQKRLLRWATELAVFDFEIKHRSGKSNLVADALSRNPFFEADDAELPLPTLASLNDDSEISKAQLSDKYCTNIIEKLSKNPNLPFKIHQGILYRIGRNLQLVVPKQYQNDIIEEYHERLFGGHQGAKKTYNRISVKYYWPGMRSQIFTYIYRCNACQSAKIDHRQKAGLARIIPISTPWARVGLDFIGPLQEAPPNYKYIIVACDYLTKYIECAATSNTTAKTAIKFLSKQIIYRWGPPRYLITDKATAFLSAEFKNFCDQHHINHRTTIGYHPSTNGQCERDNGTLLEMIRSHLIDIKNKSKNWTDMIARIQYAYNTTPHSITGYSPFYLSTGRNPNIAVDNKLIPEDMIASFGEEKYDELMKKKLVDAWNDAARRIKQQQMNFVQRFNNKHRITYFLVGDFVMVKIMNPSKLGPKYKGPYIVVKRSEYNPMHYYVQEVLNPSSQKMVHADSMKLYYDERYQFAIKNPLPREFDNPLVEIEQEDFDKIFPKNTAQNQVTPESVRPIAADTKSISDTIIYSCQLEQSSDISSISTARKVKSRIPVLRRPPRMLETSLTQK
ncbi:hypothetical protein B4U79_07363 [Dinothrombium tinctorium]|uniref:RNA-directed DNA polymerase n=1 Tax=Dinothrombium tinctorium TaxID=1965070 RepID=A0A3S3ND78_9ACAR|nr:hypothetical protein B4U79_07363 [Dinothrombium tinctorium]